MLKPTLESLRTAASNSFLVRRFNEKAFSAPYHFHPELELTLILKGEGKRYVGNNMSQYTAGDLVLLGADLPHCWKSENLVKGKISNASSVVLQFREDCLGAGFFKNKEMIVIHRLLQKSTHGIQFLNRSATAVAGKLLELDKEPHPFKKMILFLEVLHMLAGSKEFLLLNKEKETTVASSTDQSRINDIMAYIVEHFKKQITLDKAAAIAGMTPTAFCKYFKRVTRKTFIETVLEYRINYAMQQLVNTDHSISHISFESGFGDVSHFYKTFRTKQKLSPLHYRKKFRMDAFQ
ncbi:MAG: AraC family transcriptional regulator [Chitinophagaceae bacterium]|nr:AraC family transcriptional regulator [Chitinophagaceae bacterium]